MKEIPFQIFQIESWAQIPEGLRVMQEDIERRVIPAQERSKGVMLYHLPLRL